MAGLASELSLNQTQELISRLGRAGLTLERAIALMSDDSLVAEWLSAYPTRSKRSLPTLRVTVDYSRDLAEMIKAGKYARADQEITNGRFPIIQKGTSDVDLVLVHLDRETLTVEVDVELDNRGLRPATIKELLALGAAHPELQRQFPIVAYGSRWIFDNREFSPVLCGQSNNLRELSLVCCSIRWSNKYRFLAVRK